MKLHRNVAFGIVSGLKRTIVDKKPASDVIKKLLKSNSKWGSRDRKVIAKVFYDVIRQKRLIQQALELDNNSSDHFFKINSRLDGNKWSKTSRLERIY